MTSKEERAAIEAALLTVYEGYSMPADRFESDSDWAVWQHAKLTKAFSLLQKVCRPAERKLWDAEPEVKTYSVIESGLTHGATIGRLSVVLLSEHVEYVKWLRAQLTKLSESEKDDLK